MKANTSVFVCGGAIAHHQARSLQPLVQSFAMPYNGSYFVVIVKGCANALVRSAPGARASPKRKKPVVSTPLVTPGNKFRCAGRRSLTFITSERFPSIRSDDSICLRESLDLLVLFSRNFLVNICLLGPSQAAPHTQSIPILLNCEQQQLRKEGFV